MSAHASTGSHPAWPSSRRGHALALQLFETVADQPLVSVHNGLPARYLAEDVPITDPINLLISHDQGLQTLLRSSGIRPEFTLSNGWRTGDASRQAFVLLWRHLVEVWARPWMQADGDAIAGLVGMPSFREDLDPKAVYDGLIEQLIERPLYPRHVLSAANLSRFATSDDPADNLHAHELLAEDPALSGRIVPTFSPDRFLDPAHRRWRTDADLLAEVTGVGTEDLGGFLEALQERRHLFRRRGAVATEHHSSDVSIARLSTQDAAGLYRLARSAELLPAEALALQGHLLWEMGRMASEDGLVMGLFPPAGFTPRTSTDASSGDRGIAARVRPLLTDFGESPNFGLQLFTIDTDAYLTEILPLAAEHPALSAVPPTRFADDPAVLRAVRVAAITSQGVGRSLGVVDDMSGPFVLSPRHRLGRRLDAGALAELVVARRFTLESASAELTAAVAQDTLTRALPQACDDSPWPSW